MIEISITQEFEKLYATIPLSIKKKAEKQQAIFSQNPFYPSLHVEKLEPRNKQLWSFRIDKSYRIIFKFINLNQVVFLTIGTHDWVYKIVKTRL